jgi:PAS domain S-box-containing protein
VTGIALRDDASSGPLPQIVARLAGCRSSAEVLDLALTDEILRYFAATGAAIYRFDDAGRFLQISGKGGSPPRPGWPAIIEQGSAAPAARAVRDARLVTAKDGRQLAAPLSTGTRRIGVLATCHRTPVAESAREIVSMVANLLATVFAGLEAQERERRLRTQMDILRNASAAITARLSIVPDDQIRSALRRQFRLWPALEEAPLPDFLRPVLHTILDHAMQAVGAQLGALGVNSTATEPFDPWLVSGVGSEQTAAIGRLPRPVGTLGIVALEGHVVRTADVRTHPAFRGFPAHHPDVTSLMGIPIAYADGSIGNLYLGNKQDGAFSAEDQEVVELLAFQAGIAVQHAYFRAAVDVQKTQLQVILDKAPHGILFVDAKTDRMVANPRAIELLDTAIGPAASRSQLLGLFLAADGSPIADHALPSTRALRGEITRGQEFIIARSDGRRVPVILSAVPVPDADSQILGAVVTLEDISQLKELERLREEFAAIVAHDLRNPLAAILLQIAALRTLKASGDSRALQAALNRIERNAARLSQMTNDLLDVSRLESGRMTLAWEPLDLSGAVRNLVDRLRPTFGRHRLMLELPEAVPTLQLDPLRFDQILSNLLENAAKFSPEDAAITVRVVPADDGVVISVQDRGIGIPAEDLPRLFDRFYQSKRAREHKSGLGLGLYITKGLVEAHGGRLWLESEPNRGSTFFVWFPRTTVAVP